MLILLFYEDFLKLYLIIIIMILNWLSHFKLMLLLKSLKNIINSLFNFMKSREPTFIYFNNFVYLINQEA